MKLFQRHILTAGRSVIFSAFCVFIGLGAMLLIQVDIIPKHRNWRNDCRLDGCS